MKFKIIIYAIILLPTIFQKGLAQNNDLRFTSINGVNGKPIGKIRNITQDVHGYMWFSGESEKCVYRYDGARIIAFRHDNANPNSLGGVGINSIYADNTGMIWIGLGEGLDQYNPETKIFKHYRHIPSDPGSLGRGGVNPVLRDSRGRLWIGT
jgi:ligand-binding sensor domain-containing protein